MSVKRKERIPVIFRKSLLNRKPPRVNLKAQEETVAALWDFQQENNAAPSNGKAKRLPDGTLCSLKAVGNALDRILKAFGYERIHVE